MPKPIDLALVAKHLPGKAVGLGEAHDSDKARSVLLEWIKQGLVKDLVLELAEPWEHDGVRGTQYTQVLAMQDKKWGNPVSFTALIDAALKAGVKVHCWDPGDTIYAGGANVRSRNKAVARAFKKHFGGDYPVQNAAGCVILFGAKHFGDTNGSLDIRLQGLVWADLSN